MFPMRFWMYSDQREDQHNIAPFTAVGDRGSHNQRQ